MTTTIRAQERPKKAQRKTYCHKSPERLKQAQEGLREPDIKPHPLSHTAQVCFYTFFSPKEKTYWVLECLWSLARWPTTTNWISECLRSLAWWPTDNPLPCLLGDHRPEGANRIFQVQKEKTKKSK